MSEPSCSALHPGYGPEQVNQGRPCVRRDKIGAHYEHTCGSRNEPTEVWNDAVIEAQAQAVAKARSGTRTSSRATLVALRQQVRADIDGAWTKEQWVENSSSVLHEYLLTHRGTFQWMTDLWPLWRHPHAVGLEDARACTSTVAVRALKADWIKKVGTNPLNGDFLTADPGFTVAAGKEEKVYQSLIYREART